MGYVRFGMDGCMVAELLDPTALHLLLAYRLFCPASADLIVVTGYVNVMIHHRSQDEASEKLQQYLQKVERGQKPCTVPYGRRGSYPLRLLGVPGEVAPGK
ncbi:uncharacterized protein FYN12_015854 [Phoenicopterus ruber ruber]